MSEPRWLTKVLAKCHWSASEVTMDHWPTGHRGRLSATSWPILYRHTTEAQPIIQLICWLIHWSTPPIRHEIHISRGLVTGLLTNMRIVKFKSHLTIAFFAAVSHLSGPLRKQNFALTGSKGHGFWFVIDGFGSVLCVSVFQGSLLVIIIMIDGSEKRNCEGGLWTLEFACLWKVQ